MFLTISYIMITNVTAKKYKNILILFSWFMNNLKDYRMNLS